MTANVIPLDRRARRSLTLPAFRVAESGMEIGEAGRRIREGLGAISRLAWGRQDIAELRQISDLVKVAATVEVEGRRIAGWADGPDDDRGAA